MRGGHTFRQTEDVGVVIPNIQTIENKSAVFVRVTNTTGVAINASVDVTDDQGNVQSATYTVPHNDAVLKEFNFTYNFQPGAGDVNVEYCAEVMSLSEA